MGQLLIVIEDFGKIQLCVLIYNECYNGSRDDA
jgi:hypothetical protein